MKQRKLSETQTAGTIGVLVQRELIDPRGHDRVSCDVLQSVPADQGGTHRISGEIANYMDGSGAHHLWTALGIARVTDDGLHAIPIACTEPDALSFLAQHGYQPYSLTATRGDLAAL